MVITVRTEALRDIVRSVVDGRILGPMLRKLVVLAFLALVVLAAFVFLAPLMPSGSWVHDAGGRLHDGLAAWWGFPIVGP
jgi:hypothetical protein